MFHFLKRAPVMISAEEALVGRAEPLKISGKHTVLGTSMMLPFEPPIQFALFAMGCFWGAERAFWKLAGVHSTAVGYTAGYTQNPTYEEVCSGRTGHTEAVLVAYDPAKISFDSLLKAFWESHDPTTPNRQGNDVGTQYRSGLYTTSKSQYSEALLSRDVYQRALTEAGRGSIATEIRKAEAFYYAEEYHQQYLDKNPGGYCGLGGTGVSCPVGTGVAV
ncbi:MAG: peptide-methionine (S)-S-oxide reductase MsrA [Deltaproteobacteria bacterium]|nr:peptide-methionine (S)-S-oxide reductase MsrA [Deltaproteobacteria bacterium]